VVLSDVDGADNHDVVLVQRGEIGGMEEALARATEVIQPAREAMLRIDEA